MRQSRIYRILVLLGLCAVIGWSWRVYGPHPVDDAYITFRYARNLAAGRGFVYNTDEKVLGSSTPLYTLLLGCYGWAGLDIVKSGVGIGIFAGLGALLLTILWGKMLGCEESGWLAALLMATQITWVLIFFSGMETMLYCLVVVATLACVGRGRWRWVGALIGLACLIRYDGAILGIAALAVTAWRGGWRRAALEFSKAAAIYLPWLIFAWIYFGSPIPQSVQAKMLINNFTYRTITGQYLEYFGLIPLFYIWLPPSIYGVIMAVRRERRWILAPLWWVLYLGAFFIQRRPVMFYPWYLVPLLPCFYFMGVYGLADILNRITKPISRAGRLAMFAAIGLFLLGINIAYLMELEGAHGGRTLHRERKYQMAGEILRGHIKAGKTIYLGEVGTLGWFLPQARIIDSAGILSPEVHQIRLRDRQNMLRQGKSLTEYPDDSTSVTLMVIHELRPDFIASDRKFLFLEEIRLMPEFKKLYNELETGRLNILDLLAFQRKKN